MLIDLIFLSLLFFAGWRGWRAGFFKAIVSFTGMFIGFFLAMKCSASVSVYIKANKITDPRWVGLLAFVLVLIVVWLLLHLLAKTLSGMANALMLGWLNKTAGLLIFVLLYLIIISGLLLFADKFSFFSNEMIKNSTLYPIIYPVAPSLLNGVGEWIPWLRETFSDLDRSFS